jgi:hypothetical protein
MTVSEEVERDYSVSWIYKHPYYASVGSPSNDIALVRLYYPMTFTSRVSSICLPHPESDPEPGRQCVVTGWGRYVDQFKTSTTSKSTVHSSATHDQTSSAKPTSMAVTKSDELFVKNATISFSDVTIRTTFGQNQTALATTASSTMLSSSSRDSLSSFHSTLSHTVRRTTNAFWNSSRKVIHGTNHASTHAPTSVHFDNSTRTSTTGNPHNSTLMEIPKPPQLVITSGSSGHLYKPLHASAKGQQNQRLLRLRLQQPRSSSIAVHAEVLQQAVLPIFVSFPNFLLLLVFRQFFSRLKDRKNCSAYWKSLLRDNMICTFPSQTSAEPCKVRTSSYQLWIQVFLQNFQVFFSFF